ncbi:MAG TPA: hypothetical protein VME20_11660 [Acidimicrobiales bacterium]|nr:hypothetical protein [Acidimicrobiales bacterium]
MRTCDNPVVERDEYIRAARQVRDANNIHALLGSRASFAMGLPIGGGRRVIKVVADVVRHTESELRALEPPPEDEWAIEQHFLRPWSELAEYLDALVAAPRTWWVGPRGAFRLLEHGPQDRPEDVDFCVAYGLDDGSGAVAWTEQAEATGDDGNAPEF